MSEDTETTTRVPAEIQTPGPQAQTHSADRGGLSNMQVSESCLGLELSDIHFGNYCPEVVVSSYHLRLPLLTLRIAELENSSLRPILLLHKKFYWLNLPCQACARSASCPGVTHE